MRSGLQPVHLGHSVVKNNNIAFEFRRFFDRLKPIRGFATDLPPCMALQKMFQSSSHGRMIVGD